MSPHRDPPFVVIADDDPRYLSRLRGALRVAGAQVAACRTVTMALDALRFHLPSVVVVAPQMEDGRGWDLAYAASAQSHVQTVVLDRDESGVTRRTAFAAGVDDVLALPQDDAEIASRVVALAARRHRSESGGPVYRHRGLVMDVAAHTVWVDARSAVLTAQQFAILRALLEANGATLSRDRLLTRIQALDDEPPSERAIDLHVRRLRERLGDDARRPRFVESVYGVGYRLASSDAEPAEFEGDAQRVLAALPDPLLVIDAERRVRFANEAATRFLGRPGSDIVGQRCGDVLQCRDRHGELLAGARCFARAVADRGGALRNADAEVAAGDERVPVRLTYSSVHGDGLTTLEIRPRDGTEPLADTGRT